MTSLPPPLNDQLVLELKGRVQLGQLIEVNP
jgi:hypothetical protein